MTVSFRLRQPTLQVSRICRMSQRRRGRVQTGRAGEAMDKAQITGESSKRGSSAAIIVPPSPFASTETTPSTSLNALKRPASPLKISTGKLRVRTVNAYSHALSRARLGICQRRKSLRPASTRMCGASLMHSRHGAASTSSRRSAGVFARRQERQAHRLDHAGNFLRLGLVTDIGQDHLDDGKQREGSAKKERGEALPRLCPQCTAVLPRNARACSACGLKTRRHLSRRAADGDLVELRLSPERQILANGSGKRGTSSPNCRGSKSLMTSSAGLRCSSETDSGIGRQHQVRRPADAVPVTSD